MPVLKSLCEYKRVNRLSLKADVLLPSARQPPILLCIHGGALMAGSRNYLGPYHRNLFRKAGFALVSIDYRLAPETRLPFIIEDIRDAVRWVTDKAARIFDLDPERLAVTGESAGGYLSLMTGTFERKPRAIVSFYGYGDILGDWYTQPSPFYCQQPPISRDDAYASVGGPEKSRASGRRGLFYLYCRQHGTWPEAVSGYSLATEREKLLPYCPAYNVGSDYPPTLLLHGDQDTDVPCQQSVQMSEELTRHSVENRLVIVKNGQHGFDRDTGNPEVRRVLDEAVDFLRAHLS